MGYGNLVHLERALDGRGAIVRLNRPEALNALNGPLLDELDSVLDELAADAAIRVAILTGNQKCFSAGADLKEDLPDRIGRIKRMHALALRLRDFPALTISAIEGWALGGGLELAMACTFRAAAPGARLGLPEIHLGVIPSFGGTQLAPRLIGTSRALELLCTGDPLEADSAQQIGLVNWVAQENGGALALALEHGALFAQRPQPAVQAARAAVQEGAGLGLEEALAVELKVIARMLGGSDAADAVTKFRSRAERTAGK